CRASGDGSPRAWDARGGGRHGEVEAMSWSESWPQGCAHRDVVAEVVPSSDGCEDCLRTGDLGVHLRMCMTHGHISRCDSTDNRHATAHWHANPDHPIVRSYEPGEDWWWCYADELPFQVEGAPAAPSHP